MSPKTFDGLMIYYGATVAKTDTSGTVGGKLGFADRLAKRRKARRAWVEELYRELFTVTENSTYRYDERGKPFFSDGPHFSISHNDKMTVVAFSGHSEIGVDIQVFNERRTCSFNSYFRTDLTARDAACIWVRMEAISKYYGMGLGYGLNKLFNLATVFDQDDAIAGYRLIPLRIEDVECAVCVASCHPVGDVRAVRREGIKSHAN